MRGFRSNPMFFLAVLSLTFVPASRAQTESADFHLARARQFVKEGKTESAIVEYEAAVKQEPANIEAQGNLGVLEFFANDCSDALPHLLAALKLDSSQARIQALAGICQRNQNQLEEAEHNLSAALSLVSNPKIHSLILTNLVEIEAERGEMVAAAVHVSELTKSDNSNPDALYLAYRVYSELADSARNELTLVAPDSARMHLLTAERFVNAGDVSMAIAQYEQALVKQPSMLGVHYELGEAIMQESASQESLDRATKELQLALKEDPRNAGAVAKLGVIEGIRGNSQLAESDYIRALSLKPDEFNALVGLGNIMRDRGENERAAQYLARASKVVAMDDSLHYQLAQLYRKLGRGSDADQEMEFFAMIRNLKSNLSRSDQRRVATQPADR